MLTVDNQKYLLTLANIYSVDAIKAIKNSDYAKQPEEIVKQDIKDFIHIILNNNHARYFNLDTAARDALMDILIEEFNFIDAETMMILSQVILRAMQSNNEAIKAIYNGDAIEALEKENKMLQGINSMLCRYAQRIDPEMD
jgi:tagatose-1,6-bisphosphate aldolase non-catalytic subunit AgaZ/GatZ